MKLASVFAIASLMAVESGAAQTTTKRDSRTVADAIRLLADHGYAGGGGPALTPAVAAKRMTSFGRCVMSDPGKAGTMLATMPGSAEELSIARKIAKDRAGCLQNGGSLTFGPSFLRGSIAEGMLRRDFGVIGAGARRRTSAVFQMAEPSERTELPAKTQAALRLYDLADCTVSRAREKVSTLLSAQPMSGEEDSAWRQLSTTLNDCIDPKQALKINKLQLRGTLAEAGYRASVKTSAMAAR